MSKRTADNIVVGYEWPFIEASIGKAFHNYERALIEECIVDAPRFGLGVKTMELRQILVKQIMELLAANVGLSADEFERKLASGSIKL